MTNDRNESNHKAIRAKYGNTKGKQRRGETARVEKPENLCCATLIACRWLRCRRRWWECAGDGSGGADGGEYVVRAAIGPWLLAKSKTGNLTTKDTKERKGQN